MSVPAINDRYGVTSLLLKAVIGLTSSDIHQIFSGNKKQLTVTIYPTRRLMISTTQFGERQLHQEKVFDHWWENIDNWDRYHTELMETLSNEVGFYLINGAVVSEHDAFEAMYRMQQHMTKGSNMKELIVYFTNSEKVEFVYRIGNDVTTIQFSFTD